MSTLNGFPVVSQLTPISWDGSSPNAQFDCMPACLCAGSMYLKGIQQVDTQWNPDKFLDAAYPEGYHGGTDAANYVKFCASLGVHLFSVNGDPAQQVAQIHQYLAKDSPVIITMADPYVPASYGWTHAVIAHQDASGEITVLDPYIAKNVTHSDSEWESLIRGNVLWILERIEDVVTIDLNMPIISGYFTLVNGNQWQRKNAPNGKVIILHGDMLKNYQTCGTVPYCGLSQAGLPESNEIPIEQFGPEFAHLAGSGIKIVYLERQVWIYDPKHLIDNPPGAGTVYPLHLYQLPGQDPLVTKLQAQVIAQQATITAQEAQITQLQAQQTSEPDPIAAIHAVQAAVAPFK